MSSRSSAQRRRLNINTFQRDRHSFLVYGYRVEIAEGFELTKKICGDDVVDDDAWLMPLGQETGLDEYGLKPVYCVDGNEDYFFVPLATDDEFEKTRHLPSAKVLNTIAKYFDRSPSWHRLPRKFGWGSIFSNKKSKSGRILPPPCPIVVI